MRLQCHNIISNTAGTDRPPSRHLTLAVSQFCIRKVSSLHVLDLRKAFASECKFCPVAFTHIMDELEDTMLQCTSL